MSLWPKTYQHWVKELNIVNFHLSRKFLFPVSLQILWREAEHTSSRMRPASDIHGTDRLHLLFPATADFTPSQHRHGITSRQAEEHGSLLYRFLCALTGAGSKKLKPHFSNRGRGSVRTKACPASLLSKMQASVRAIRNNSSRPLLVKCISLSTTVLAFLRNTNWCLKWCLSGADRSCGSGFAEARSSIFCW